jgi:hypothetical protein
MIMDKKIQHLKIDDTAYELDTDGYIRKIIKEPVQERIYVR